MELEYANACIAVGVLCVWSVANRKFYKSL